MSSKFDYIKVGIASADRIRSWSRGEVTKPETINYRTLKPERDGLFCERIFGPAKDWECHCGKYKRVRHKGIICERCGVEVTDSKVRRYRMGHIELAAPVAHIWYLKGIPSYLSLLLDVPLRTLEDVVYFNAYIVIDPGNSGLEKRQTLTEDAYEDLLDKNPDVEFVAKMGAEAVKELLETMDLQELATEMKADLPTASAQKKAKLIKRLRVVEAFLAAGSYPSAMILNVIPVIPPDLRPMVQLDGGRFATSDLNDLYRRVINRNNRLYRLKDMGAPDIIIRNEMRMLQEAVDALIDNGRRGRAVVGPNNRPLKSLSDIIEGKQGRFRQNLLGKRVDYSGRSVIVVGPNLKLHQCGLPKEMALELFKPFVMNKLVERGIVQNIKSAKKKIERGENIVWDILEEVIKGHPVLLNRAPTLHRLGIQAFEPVLVEGRAIQIHPLVCTAFNADFDGDQMAVHVPLSVEAQTEARLLMLASNNVLSPATGQPIITPTQDMVLGIYYLTVEQARDTVGQGMIFPDFAAALSAHASGLVSTHAKIAIRYAGPREDGYGPEVAEHFPEASRDWVRRKLEARQILVTTVGRIIVNERLPHQFPFYNLIINKKELGRIIMRAYNEISTSAAAELADNLKNLGFRWATQAGVSIAISDLTVPNDKKKILRDAEERIEASRKAFLRGEITEVERHAHAIDTWAETTEALTAKVVDDFDRLNSVYMMAFSGARGNLSQVRQLVGMRGLMADPSGRIIDLPIKSNFREGLNVTEYIISSYGARKGLVDTALRTADSGYLTRRLADVAQDVIIREEDCGTDRGLSLSSIKDGDATVVHLVDRIVGRVINENLVDAKTGEVLLERGTLVTPVHVDLFRRAAIETILVRSPLTCQSAHGVCRQCYGWSLTNNKLVDVGEAVGIIAAQSIGEPGTQLTMRTFHTGGVFTKGASNTAIKTKGSGTVELGEVVTVKHRTKHGQIVDVTDRETSIRVKGAKKVQEIVIPVGFAIRVKDGESIPSGTVVAEAIVETGRTSRKSLERGFKDISSDISGQVEFQDFVAEEKRDRQGNTSKTANKGGIIWVLQGDVFNLPVGAALKVADGQPVSEGDVIAETTVSSEHGGVLRIGSDVELEERDGKTIVKSGRDISIVTADLTCVGCEVLPGKKDPVLRVGAEGDERAYSLKVADGQRVENGLIIAESIDERLQVPMAGEIRHLDVQTTGPNMLLTGPSRLLFIPEERLSVNKDISLLNPRVKDRPELGLFATGDEVTVDDEVVKDVRVKNNGVLEVVEDNNIIREVVVYPGTRYEIPADFEVKVEDGALIEAGTELAEGIVAHEDGVVRVLPMPEDATVNIVVVRRTNEMTIAPEVDPISFVSTSGDLSLHAYTRLLVKDRARVKKDAPIGRTDVELRIGGALANLAGKVELPDSAGADREGFKVTILESMNLRRDIPALAKRADQREQTVVTYLLAAQGDEVAPGTTIIRTEILSHEGGRVQFPILSAARILIVTPDHEVKVGAIAEPIIQDGDFVQEGANLGGVTAPISGKVRFGEDGMVYIRHARPYLISTGTQLLTDDLDMVMRGETLATLVYDRVKTGDIIQGLPRVEELLEGRKPKESALMAEQAGVIQLKMDGEEASGLTIRSADGIDHPYSLPAGSRIKVGHGDTVVEGDLLTEGPVNPHDALRILGVEPLQRFLVDEVQMVYRSQGVEIADKHIEVIVRQMTRKMRVEDPGDTTMLPGELVDSLDVERLQAEAVERGGSEADVVPVLLGITKASLNTESFVSAASFQETTRVLTEAAIEGKRDWLHGLKENVVIGRLIPAGTGFFQVPEEEEAAISDTMLVGSGPVVL
jgi:DNA-directed RNA polymerase subunit beta'